MLILKLNNTTLAIIQLAMVPIVIASTILTIQHILSNNALFLLMILGLGDPLVQVVNLVMAKDVYILNVLLAMMHPVKMMNVVLFHVYVLLLCFVRKGIVLINMVICIVLTWIPAALSLTKRCGPGGQCIF